MTQPDNFGFTEEAALLKDSARKLLAEKFTADVLHGMVAGDPTPERGPALHWDEALWAQMQELGWGLLAVPEAQGGVGMPLVAVAGLCEELGRAAFPCPLLPTLSASYLLGAAGAGGEAPLEAIAEGATASLAVSDANGSWDLAQTPVECIDGKLNGTACFVQDIGKVSHLLVCARNGDTTGLYWLAVDAPGVDVQADAIVDLSRDQGRVVFAGVEAMQVCADASAAFARAMPAIWTLYAADMVGAGEWQLQTTVDYANQRQQFDRPLGFFQAVKHQLVDVMVDIDRAKSLVYSAACAWDTEPEEAARYAHMAQSAASDMAASASSRSVQCHGGIGFTWECFVHLFFKRQKHSQMLWGDGPWHRARLASIVMG
ncbi:acyl-CoA dehydrogenase [Halioglobus japonicus]|uniref:Acyl-CoA dehydrogenase n=1 Tax=Halioglobus japonicus TaxID=930805 RepID=A0AAP8SNJ3_9GAMM|nr:acyl-CoA dehydrogenase family protein [Halioglobus japonicus]AQA18671.1 acyl-CoA dehydrogenase [Halioglobus japonicus]PLW86700.1 acyl-CoA dehydrogenase [Halioglobus japonicus]GHD11523.1 acyl-CoA dehydrogenase [Halioglobus japonicus]